MLARLSLAPSTVRLELPAEAAQMRELRRRLRRWLEARGMPKSEREATVLAISEACNNSIEHAYRKRSGTFKVVVEHRAETLEIRISDEGEWREPVQDSTRRKGLTLMTGLTRSARIEGGETGTEVVLEQRL